MSEPKLELRTVESMWGEGHLAQIVQTFGNLRCGARERPFVRVLYSIDGETRAVALRKLKILLENQRVIAAKGLRLLKAKRTRK